MFGGLCRVIRLSPKRMSAERPCARASTLRAQAAKTLLGDGTREYAGIAALSADEAAVKRGTGGGGACGDAELAEDRLDVAANRVHAHDQPLGDLLVCEATGEQLK